MPELPAGTVTFLFTDIEKSARALVRGRLSPKHRLIGRSIMRALIGV